MRVLVLLTVIVATVLVTAAAAAGVVVGPATDEHGPLPLEFRDATGAKQQVPFFSVAGGYPGMKAQTSAVHLYNPATQAVAYDLKVGVTNPTSGPQLADVLRATVIDKRTGEVVYRGSLADLQLEGATPLGAGDTLRLVLRIDWPDGGAADNAYQGLHAGFTVTARARSLA